jgi:hypothetical protein
MVRRVDIAAHADDQGVSVGEGHGWLLFL